MPSGFISGPLAHTRGSALWDIKGAARGQLVRSRLWQPPICSYLSWDGLPRLFYRGRLGFPWIRARKLLKKNMLLLVTGRLGND